MSDPVPEESCAGQWSRMCPGIKTTLPNGNNGNWLSQNVTSAENLSEELKREASGQWHEGQMSSMVHHKVEGKRKMVRW